MQAERWTVLVELFSELVTLGADARAARLREIDSADAALSAELGSLLHAHEAAGPLDAPAEPLIGVVTGATSAAGAVAARLGPQAGDLVGPYRLLRQVGTGGMGSVWLAERGDGILKRPVALKLPHWSWVLPDLAARMAREREILAGLEHPNIARLYDAGVDRLGRPYLALEYVEGESIDRYCADRQLPPPAVLRLLIQVMHAVAYAHSHLVVHRDLKPGNVLVTREGSVRLLDFGIAKLLEDSLVPDTRLTRFAGRALTPDYASPEQIMGAPIGTGSDVYSLGVMTYQLLSGALPYRLKRASMAELEEAISSAEPRPASEAAVDALRRQALRGDLDAILNKALKKHPAARYASVGEFADDLARHLRGEAVRAVPDRWGYRLNKFLTRHKGAAALGALALGAILSAAGWALREAHVAALQRDRALALAARNEASSDFMDLLVTQAAQSQKPVTVRDMLARSEALAKAEFRGRPDQLGQVLDMLGSHYHTLGDDQRAEPLLRDALAAVQASADPDLRATVTCEHALAMAGIGQMAEAARVLKGQVADPRIGALPRANCLERLAFLAQDQNDPVGALSYGNQAWQQLQEAGNVSPGLQGEFLGSIAYAEHLSGHNDEADRYYRLALGKFAEVGEENSPGAVAVRNNWAIVSDGAGNPRRALALYEEILGATRQEGDGDPPVYLVANRARALENIGRYADAQSAYRDSRDVAHRSGSLPAEAYCILGLASTALELGDGAGAKAALAQAVGLIDGSGQRNSPAGVAALLLEGRLALADGRLDDAHAAMTQALAHQPAVPATLTALLGRAEVELAQDRLGDAARDAEDALARAESLQGGIPYSNRTGRAWFVLGRVRARRGDVVGARAAFTAAVAHFSNTVDDTHPELRQARELLANAV